MAGTARVTKISLTNELKDYSRIFTIHILYNYVFGHLPHQLITLD